MTNKNVLELGFLIVTEISITINCTMHNVDQFLHAPFFACWHARGSCWGLAAGLAWSSLESTITISIWAVSRYRNRAKHWG